ncbi:hypothetical protein BC941DRAFT_440404 [Chlamydoabsidia padenii]|nr:hypothetical protein BC941DRAFT_440404 [Chlamydoabsidia padenii]
MMHDSQHRRKRPLPKLPHRSASGQFISVGPCWLSTSHSWSGDAALCEPPALKKVHDSMKMETHVPTTDYQGIHQKPYEPSPSTSSSSLSSSTASSLHHHVDEDRSNCTSPLDSSSPHTPEDQYHDASLLKRYASPIYPLSHRHSMLLASSMRDMPSLHRSLSTVDLTSQSTTWSPYTQTPNEIDHPTTTPFLTVASFSLTHDKDALTTYRRMATKTKNRQTQLLYMMYLIQVAGLYQHDGNVRLRLLQEAGYWLRKLAKARMAPALIIKGCWYLQQDGTVALDDMNVMMMGSPGSDRWEKARHCFQQAIKAAPESVEAHYELALLLSTKKPLSKRTCHTLMASFTFAADQHHHLACFKIANIFLFGQLNQTQDLDLGLYYLEKAAMNEGTISAQASFMLSCLYAGDHALIGLNSSTKLAMEGMKNPSRARHHLDRAVSLHYPEALLRMGQLTENPWQAFQWYLQANCASGMLAVARCYAHGIPGHLAVNPILAFQWCQRASDHGLDEADYLLGTYYETGFGVVPDYPKALACYDKAASKGYTPADEKLNRQQPSHQALIKNQGALATRKQEWINCTIM